MVAGFDAWKKKFHRHVLAGEKGITIIGYALKYHYTEEAAPG